MNQDLMTWLGKQAADHYILPPKKRSSSTKLVRLRGQPVSMSDEEETTAVQSPHRYGRKLSPASGATTPTP